MAVKDAYLLTVESQEITLTHPHKRLWEEPVITKLDYVHYLAALVPYLLKHTGERCLTTIRYPQGISGKSFYQKNCPEHAPPFIHTHTQDNLNYIVPTSRADFIWMANLACLEFHPALHRIHDPLPDYWVMDIDPTHERGPDVCEATCLVGEALAGMHIQSVAKTSGATGFQILVPLVKGPTFEQLRALGKFISQYLVETYPHLFTIERLIKDRGNKIYLDYLQHWHGKTLAAPYTPRARPGAPVSAPVSWEEAANGVQAADFHLLNMAERLQQKGDLIEKVPPQNLHDQLQYLLSRS
ncbi:non-homologous end-joining DNA ligase [Marinicrinis sediminis]|uniref:Non-homologous end-joining DNA ligase n=1 Tax=Marinicrinis sediminis TaxID=1652465 RepID=A0ABW5R7U5_9BACL